MIDWYQTEPLPDDDPRDIEAARRGLNGTHSINAHRMLREVREGADEIARVTATPAEDDFRWALACLFGLFLGVVIYIACELATPGGLFQ